MIDEILKNIDKKLTQIAELRAEMGLSKLTVVENYIKALRVAVEEIARVPACDSNSCTTCDVIAEIATLLGVKEGEK